MENLYNTEKAKEFRKKLQEIGDKVADLQYQLFLLNKEGKDIAEEYQIYIGVKEAPKKESEENNVEES